MMHVHDVHKNVRQMRKICTLVFVHIKKINVAICKMLDMQTMMTPCGLK